MPRPRDLTSEQLRRLAKRLRAAYREECQQDTCFCITIEEHEKLLREDDKSGPHE